MLQLITESILPLALPLMLTLLVGFIIKKFNFSEGLGQATRDLMAGVSNTYETYTKEIKKGRADGKLTEDEKRISREMAWQKAKEIATTKGTKFLTKLGKEKGMQMINTIVQKLRKQ